MPNAEHGGYRPDEPTQKKVEPAPETPKTLPVISYVEYSKQILDLRPGEVFNFQGYLDPDGYAPLSYHDMMLSGSILGDRSETEFRVLTEGEAKSGKMKGPADVTKYSVKVDLPKWFLQESGSYVVDGALRSVKELGENEDEIDDAQHLSRDIIVPLSVDPTRDKHAREKAEIIHMSIVRHLEKRKSPEEIGKMVSQLE